MRQFTAFVWLCVAAQTVTGCATYQRQDLNPAATEVAFRERTLGNPGLRAFAAANSTTKPSQWPPEKFDLPVLTLVAFYFHPDLDVARARLVVAAAGVRTAGARPNPTLNFGGEHHSIAEAVSPWTLGFTLDIPVETAGKRGYRIAQAQAISDAARVELAETGWQVRSRLRAATLAVARQPRVVVPYFWDGTASSLEEQALAPIADPAEMGNTHEAMVEAQGHCRLRADPPERERAMGRAAGQAGRKRAVASGPPRAGPVRRAGGLHRVPQGRQLHGRAVPQPRRRLRREGAAVRGRRA